MKCPACFNQLTEIKIGSVKVDVCKGGCAGVWLDAFELQQLEKAGGVSQASLRIERDPSLQVDFSRKRDCPRCEGVKLARHFFSAKRQVEVDQCPNCNGYWLDAGELDKIHEEITIGAAANIRSTQLSMEAIRTLYRQKLEKRSRA
jgi:uncharacterized protein